jgi:hypothetical protein
MRKCHGGTVSSRQSQKQTWETTSIAEISFEGESIELVDIARRRPRRKAKGLHQDLANSCVVNSSDGNVPGTKKCTGPQSEAHRSFQSSSASLLLWGGLIPE